MIRRIEKYDKPAVMDMIKRTEMFTTDEADIAEELIDKALNDPDQKDYHVIVNTEQEKVTGYLCYGPTDCTEGTYDLYWMAVDPQYQGRGTGRLMLSWLEKKAAAMHGRMIIIETSSLPKYEPTRRFYIKAGYQEAARIPDFYKPGDDRVIYTKRFDQS